MSRNDFIIWCVLLCLLLWTSIRTFKNVAFISLSKQISEGDTCNWKGQLEKTRNWKLLSWKVRIEIGKNEVGKFEPKFLITLYCIEKFPTTIRTFQLKWKFSNSKLLNLKNSYFSFFPTPLSNYMYPPDCGFLILTT